eukprot:scaffold2360_cov142-Skeletonema_dohrnii-CCMP3373.AAC.3
MREHHHLCTPYFDVFIRRAYDVTQYHIERCSRTMELVPIYIIHRHYQQASNRWNTLRVFWNLVRCVR